MGQDATWYGGRPRAVRHCVRWGPIPKREGDTAAPTLRAMSVVAKRLDGSRCHTWYGGIGIGPGHIQLDGSGTQLPTERGTAAPPHFSAHIYYGQTVAHLSNC